MNPSAESSGAGKRCREADKPLRGSFGPGQRSLGARGVSTARFQGQIDRRDWRELMGGSGRIKGTSLSPEGGRFGRGFDVASTRKRIQGDARLRVLMAPSPRTCSELYDLSDTAK